MTENGTAITLNPGAMEPSRMVIDGVLVDRVTVAETLRLASAWMSPAAGARTRARLIVTINVQFLQAARTDARFRRVLAEADLSVADGVPIVWASRLLDAPLPERVNGTNLMVQLCELAAAEGRSVYLMGGRPGAAEGAARELVRRFPALRIAGTDCPPFGFDGNREQKKAAAEKIAAARPDVVFVAMGAPKQEFWIAEHMHLPVGLMMGVGGSFEMVAGFVKRAPVFWQNAGLEWLWRLGMEPGRLWKRYLIGNSEFVWQVGRQWLQQWRRGTTAAVPGRVPVGLAGAGTGADAVHPAGRTGSEQTGPPL